MVYIAGRGHSGTTLLGALLGSAPGVFDTGELISGLRRYDGKCSCGEHISKCPTWDNMRRCFDVNSSTDFDTAASQLRESTHIKRFLSTYFARPSNTTFRALARHNAQIIKCLAQSSYSYIIDSSKELTRSLFLAKFENNCKIIYLTRHPANILDSVYRRLDNGSGEKFLRRRYRPTKLYFPFLLLSLFSWIAGHALFLLTYRQRPAAFLIIRYEDLILDPVNELTRIENFTGIDLERAKNNIRHGHHFDIGCTIAGNAFRHNKQFCFNPKKAHIRHLPKRYTFLAAFFAFPFLKKFGHI
ncbi:sulfotransferase [Halorhodospira halochloris]|uniref:sulfotransferase n=1 Tax=Halorhodospira halochloris TaxID=1052 RepID=UPI003B75C7C1